MSTYEQAAQALRKSLLPLRDYCQRERGRIDPSDPKQQFRFNHVQQVEQALESTRAYYRAAEAILHPEPTPFELRIQHRTNFYRDPAPLTRAKLDQYFPLPSKQPAQ